MLIAGVENPNILWKYHALQQGYPRMMMSTYYALTMVIGMAAITSIGASAPAGVGRNAAAELQQPSH